MSLDSARLRAMRSMRGCPREQLCRAFRRCGAAFSTRVELRSVSAIIRRCAPLSVSSPSHSPLVGQMSSHRCRRSMESLRRRVTGGRRSMSRCRCAMALRRLMRRLMRSGMRAMGQRAMARRLMGRRAGMRRLRRTPSAPATARRDAAHASERPARDQGLVSGLPVMFSSARYTQRPSRSAIGGTGRWSPTPGSCSSRTMPTTLA